MPYPYLAQGFPIVDFPKAAPFLGEGPVGSEPNLKIVKGHIIISDGKHGWPRVTMGVVMCLWAFSSPLTAMLRGGFSAVLSPWSIAMAGFGFLGLVLLRQRAGAWIDLEKGDLVTWSTDLGPRRETRTPIRAFREVRLTRELRSMDERSITYYAIALVSDEPLQGIRYSSQAVFASSRTKEVWLYSCADQTTGRDKATWLADTLGLALQDMTG